MAEATTAQRGGVGLRPGALAAVLLGGACLLAASAAQANIPRVPFQELATASAPIDAPAALLRARRSDALKFELAAADTRNTVGNARRIAAEERAANRRQRDDAPRR